MEKILVALSGGVDSSITAAILKQNGFYVEGATMVFEGVLDEDLEYAGRVCKRLNIPYRCLDFAKKYREMIVNNFINEYQSGRTPNPCVLCNKFIKFGLFLKKAQELGFDKIATGHYASVVKGNGHYLLRQGKDKNEQSYFLYRLSQDELSRMVLPLGVYTKQEVRKLAKALNLPTAHRKKSQDVCFIPNGNYAGYLKKILPSKPGPIINKNGKVVGEHKGIVFYTYGQRRGLGLSHKRPYYVLKIDAKNNAIYVGEKEDVYKRELIANELNFISGKGLNVSSRVLAKARYFAPLSAATIEPCLCRRDFQFQYNHKQKVKVIFDKPQWALTPGQSVVFYQNSVVLGGGTIEEVIG